jgi:hypothetical protein
LEEIFSNPIPIGEYSVYLGLLLGSDSLYDLLDEQLKHVSSDYDCRYYVSKYLEGILQDLDPLTMNSSIVWRNPWNKDAVKILKKLIIKWSIFDKDI